MTSFCSNYSIPIIKSITFVNARDLENCAELVVSHPFKNKDTLLWEKIVFDLAYEFCSCVDIVVDQIKKKCALGTVKM